MDDKQARFVDQGHWIYELVNEPIDVECPRCAAQAKLVPWGEDPPTLFMARRLTCGSCGLVRDHDGQRLRFTRDGHDPCFGHPLWYRSESSQGVIWAYHRRHLELLRAYVAADLRERSGAEGCTNRSYFSRLPDWIKSAKNRDSVLKRIDRMVQDLA